MVPDLFRHLDSDLTSMFLTTETVVIVDKCHPKRQKIVELIDQGYLIDVGGEISTASGEENFHRSKTLFVAVNREALLDD